MNSDLSDIASGLSTAVTKDGQTVITAPIRFASGSVGAPAITFSADTDCGLYRIGANNIGFSVNATKILDIATTGLAVVGTVAPSTTVTNADGTVLLPAYTFASDLNSGIYRIGADNIGVAVNGAKVLDVSTSGLDVIGTVSSNGSPFAPLPQGVVMVNGTIAESHTGNAATFAVKTLSGGDPSASDPVFFVFRNVTAATGDYTVIQATAALSLTVSSGSTLGTSSGVPFRVWLTMFNDGGTLRMGIINCLSGVNIYPLGRSPLASSTAEGGVGGADSAQVFYTGSAVTSKAYGILGYASYESGLVTAGAWDASPTVIQLFGAGTPLPGHTLQERTSETGTLATGTTAIPADNSIPQITEGDEYITRSITPTSAANLLEVYAQVLGSHTVQTQISAALFQDATANALAVSCCGITTANDAVMLPVEKKLLAATTSSTTFRLRAGGNSGSTFNLNGRGGTQVFGGVANSFLSAKEVMA